MSLSVVKKSKQKTVSTNEEAVKAAKVLNDYKKQQAHKAWGEKLINKSKNQLEDLMNEYISSLQTDPDEDLIRFKKCCWKWEKICNNVMKKHPEIVLHKDGFAIYWQKINEQTNQKLFEDEQKKTNPTGDAGS